MMHIKRSLPFFTGIVTFFLSSFPLVIHAAAPARPPSYELNKAFGDHDANAFLAPPRIYYPETWFHYIGGNVSKEGITADLEAIAGAGISGIQLFHGQFGGPWPGVEPQITSLSPNWDDAVRHTAQESRRLGLRFTMQNCPGWATSGGPWIEASNAMRHLVSSRIDLVGGALINQSLPMPQPSNEDWRDYKDVAVLAFPTPTGDTGKALVPQSVTSNKEFKWEECLSGKLVRPLSLPPTTLDNPYRIEVTFPEAVMLRSVVFPSINSFNHGQCYEPGVTITIEAISNDGAIQNILHADMPQASWQDDQPITFACSEISGIKKYRISIVNKHNMSLSSIGLFSAARKNNWESEAGWTLRSIERTCAFPEQSPNAFVSSDQIVDISAMMDKDGNLKWQAPNGQWTILRIGHVNTGRRNGPAPAEGTGWECNKFSLSGSNVQFANYIGRLIADKGPLSDGLLDGMLLDSWECHTQTWTESMESEFERISDYQLRKWLPAVFGYVIQDHETTTRFLYDWRATINDLFTHNFYGNMARLADENGLFITYETAGGDVFPGDILEYFKYADIPMCEFWQPMSSGFVGSNNFKPIKPTASAARLYGKPRVAAEAFTSFSLTWDEHLEMLKEVANINSIEGVSHLVFHTYTHNPQTPFYPPGTSFGAGIGTPFLRGQTWWKFMPEFNDYLARCSYLLERGKPVSDVLWYLGDEINHKPNQNAPFPEGFKYDYCNPDILLNRLSVKKGMLMTPEGITYKVLWLADAPRMLPETLEKIKELILDGATVVGSPPEGLVTLSGGKMTQKRFTKAVKDIWGTGQEKGVRKIGKGRVISGMTLNDALIELKMIPDVIGGDALWVHRQIEGADWYFVSAPQGREFKGKLSFRSKGQAELWDPVTGSIKAAASVFDGDRMLVAIDLEKAGSCFVIFRKNHAAGSLPASGSEIKTASSIPLSSSWTLRFPSGWGAPESLEVTDLKPWKDLDIPAEGKAFSGTVNYDTVFEIGDISKIKAVTLDLGHVDMIAVVSVNGKQLRPLWARPYCVDVTPLIRSGKNTLSVEVTSTWFNRLVYDAGQPEENRKTWTINGPDKNAPLRDSGLIGPVKLFVENKN